MVWIVVALAAAQDNPAACLGFRVLDKGSAAPEDGAYVRLEAQVTNRCEQDVVGFTGILRLAAKGGERHVDVEVFTHELRVGVKRDTNADWYFRIGHRPVDLWLYAAELKDLEATWTPTAVALRDGSLLVGPHLPADYSAPQERSGYAGVPAYPLLRPELDPVPK